MVQVPAGAIVPLFNVIVLPAIAVVAEPPQPVNVEEAGVANITLAGSVSGRVVPVRVVLALFVIVIVNWLTPPAQILLGLKFLLTVGVPAPVTFNVALAGLVVVTLIPPGPEELNLPAGMVLIQFPATAEVTFTATVQDPGVEPDCAGTVPPVSEMVDVPAGADAVPPQLFDCSPAIVMLEGIVSVQAALVNAKGFGLKIVMRRREVPPAAIRIGVKVLFISAGRAMACADAVCPGVVNIETIKTTSRKRTNNLCIFYPFVFY